MKTQNQIKRTLSQEENIEIVQKIFLENLGASLWKLSKEVCKKFNFFDFKGDPQLSTCRVALKLLIRKNLISTSGLSLILNEDAKKEFKGFPKRLETPVPEPTNLPETLEGLTNLRLKLVDNDDDRKIWNRMMADEHPLGTTIFSGPQAKFIIVSDEGILGGIGFSASARNMEDRDKWIGWSADTRFQYLNAITCMSRFLIRNNVHIPNLASKVLSMSIDALEAYFLSRYKYVPYIVETFVDTTSYDGSCYKAANWIEVGETKGTGRLGKYSNKNISKKKIYLYIINKNYKQDLGISIYDGLDPLKLHKYLYAKDWSSIELKNAQLHNKTKVESLIELASRKADNPTKSIWALGYGDSSINSKFERLYLSDPDKVNMDSVLEPHSIQTQRRMAAEDTVLTIQDGTDLNYKNNLKCKDLGVVGTNNIVSGLHQHTSIAVTPQGEFLGILKGTNIARQLKLDDTPSYKIPLEEKKTSVWCEHHAFINEIAKKYPNTHVVDICDREGDFLELFLKNRSCGGYADLLVRAENNRNVVGEYFKSFDLVKREQVSTTAKIHIPGESDRPSKGKHKRKERESNFSLRSKIIQINPPSYIKDKEPITVQIVYIREETPLKASDRIEWFLLTTMLDDSPEALVTYLKWYKCRWRIEEWHRVLKSGCKVESLCHKNIGSFRIMIAVYMVVAWRVMCLLLVSRTMPDLPADLFFSNMQIDYINKKVKKQNKKSLTIKEAVDIISMFGGYVIRKDRHPGFEAFTEGFLELSNYQRHIEINREIESEKNQEGKTG